MTSLLLGTFVGVLLALTGAGGGVVSVPLLVFALHLTVAEASPIALLAVMLAAGVGAGLGLRAGIVRYRAACLLAACGLLFAPLGLWLAHGVPNTGLTLLFAVLLAFVALRLLRQAGQRAEDMDWTSDNLPPPCQVDQAQGKLAWSRPCAGALLLSGSVAGFLSGLLGVGGGFVIVPALRRFTDLEIKPIVATSLAAIALVSAGGVVITASYGLMNWNHAWPFAAGAALGMLPGSLLARHLSGGRVQQVFAVFTLLVAAGLVARLFWA